ncbi:MAG TPA: hypothetical protein VM142_05100 [Acidimicrobiales bacterium]|nr:hypothetical protein [Acidimicrobiales bacterium]
MFGKVELRGLREKVGEFAAGFDPALVSPAQANVMVDDAAAIEKMAATVKALLAARVAVTEVATREGDKTPAHALARKTGTTVGKAADAIRTGKRLAKQPKLDAAAREGKVSPEQAAAISDATEADPGAEERLLNQAEHSTLLELRNECERTKAAADKDAEERRRRILAARFARRRNCPDGSAEILFRSTIEQVAELWSVISAYATQAFNLARLEGRHEPAQAYAADGMLAMARAAVLATWAPTGRSDEASTGTAAHNGNGIADEPASATGGGGHAADPFGGDGASRADDLGGLFGTGGGGSDCGSGSPAGGDGGSSAGDQGGLFGGDPGGDDTGPGGGGGGSAGNAWGRPGAGVTSVPAPAGPAPAPPPVPGPPPVRRRPPSPTRIVVRIDWDALVRGWVSGDETCEIAGLGQVAVSVVRSMIETEDPFLAAVVTRGKDVVNVAHLGRRPSAHQLSALDWLAPTCRREGCDATVGLENDHRHAWAATRITLLEWIDRLCPHDHDLKTYEGWALVDGTGKRPLVPPEDPRHPRHTRAARPPPASLPRAVDDAPASTVDGSLAALR